MTSPDASAATMVPGFRHVPGNHCGSTALRNLLGFGGVELSEEMAFGLGAGAGFYYLKLDASPTHWFNGRTARLEEAFRDLTGALEMETFEDAGSSWDAARAEVDAGRPVLLLTDLYFLDHYGKSAHFPGHAVVLAGYDAEHAHVSDTGFEELQATSLEGLRRARHEAHPAYPLAGHMFTVAGGVDEERLLGAADAAIERAAKEMLEPPFGDYGGLPALRRLRDEAPRWPELAEDWQWCARFAYQVIERRGTGGGNFRAMYSRFLAEVGRDEAAALAGEASSAWTGLAAAFQAASEADAPKAPLWDAIGLGVERCAEAEERLWAALA